jgi:proline dehydrogenase
MSLQRKAVMVARRNLPSRTSSSFVNLENSNHFGMSPKKDAPTPRFDHCRPYKEKKVSELFRSLLVFQLCEFKPLVRNGSRLLDLTRRLVGNRVTDTIIRETFFKQFCGGQHHAEVVRKVHDLKRSNIGAILDYAAESEEETQVSAPSQGYNSHTEKICDDHVARFIQCINTVSDSYSDSNSTNANTNPFAAVKISALGNPILLQRMSDFIRQTEQMIAPFDEAGKGYLNHEEFERMYRLISNDSESRGLNDVIDYLDPKGVNAIDHVSWCTVALTKAPELQLRPRQPTFEQFTSEDIDMIQAMHSRACNIAQEAFSSDVRLLIDAEQSWIQPAIDIISQDLQESYNDANKIDHPIIYSTYQCYLKKSLHQMKMDIARSSRLGFHFGTKLVRGAYMQRERERAGEMDYASPIHDTVEDTHENYNAAVHQLLHGMVDRRASSSPLSLEVMCATHNRQSIEYAVQLMEDLEVGSSTENDGSHEMISFAQLYGMSDDLTIPIADKGYNVYKYVPFGPIREVIPYMLRRAQENGDILGKSKYEMDLIREELIHRIRRN